MTTIRTMVCVGGAYDGQRYEARGTHFEVPIRGQIPRDLEHGAAPMATAPLLTAEYQEMVWHSPSGSVSFWIEKGISELAAMEKLLNHYMKR